MLYLILFNLFKVYYIITNYYSYRETILKGAHESQLPLDYIKLLQKIPHNEYAGEYDIG